MSLFALLAHAAAGMLLILLILLILQVYLRLLAEDVINISLP